MSPTIAPIVRKISGYKDFAAADAAAKSVVANVALSAEDKAALKTELDKMLAEHKGNPDRQVVVQAEGSVVANAKEGETEKANWQSVKQLSGDPKKALLAKLAAQEITVDEAEAQLKGMKSGLSLAFNPAKGTVALRGLRRFTVAFYAEEWRTIVANGAAILAYLEENAKALAAAEAAK